MNRERLTILRDHLASLPDERVRMDAYARNADGAPTADPDKARDFLKECGTAACVAGWAITLFPGVTGGWVDEVAADALDLGEKQAEALFFPQGYHNGLLSRSDAIAAIQSMLDSPDDDALPVWPEREGAAA